MGSIVTTTEEKKSLAAKSLLFNLKDDQFVTLFPELAAKIRNTLKDKRSELLARNPQA